MRLDLILRAFYSGVLSTFLKLLSERRVILLQGSTVNLSGRVQGHGIKEDNAPRRLVSDRTLAVGNEILFTWSTRGGVFFERHVSLDVLAICLVRNANYSGRFDRRVRHQGI